jgi:predicted dehydrogenase
MKPYHVGIVGYGWAAGAHIAALNAALNATSAARLVAVLTHDVIFAAEESLRLGRPVQFEKFRRALSTH